MKHIFGEKGLAEALSIWDRKDNGGWGKRNDFGYQDMLQDGTFYILYLGIVVLKVSQILRHSSVAKILFSLAC